MTLRSLVVAPQWIGDAVMCEPLLARLAGRGETLSVAALPWVAPVFRAMPQVAAVLEWPFAHGRLDWAARWRIAADLRGRFDTAYVLPNSIKAALIPWLARIPRRVGYHGEGRFGLLNERLANPSGRPPMAPFYAALAGASDATLPPPRLQLPPDAIAGAAGVAGVTPGTYWVFAPGAEYGPAKCWPAAHYASLAQRLHAQDGASVLLLGSGKEAALCQEIAAAAGPDACRVLAGRTNLIEAMALIAAAECTRAGAVAERRTRPRLRAVFRPHLPLRSHALFK
jgi:heptosyltransferase-2